VALVTALGGTAQQVTEAGENFTRQQDGLPPQTPEQIEGAQQDEQQQGADKTPAEMVIPEPEFPVFGDPSLFDDPNAEVIDFGDDPESEGPAEPLPLPGPGDTAITFEDEEGTSLLGDPDAEFIDFEDEEVIGGEP
jgi:hypothetical protein